MNNTSWSFSKIWNTSLEQRVERPLEPRNYVWASELGGAYIDRYLKMSGEKPSNPFDSRSLRKFEAGRIFEWIVEMVLVRSGILINKQEWVRTALPGLLEVTGKLDHMAGGKPDYEKVRAEIETEFLPDFIKTAAVNIIDYFAKEYPDGLKEIVLEIKSVGSLSYHRYDTYKVADRKHSLQLYHYIKGKNLTEGHIIYISKDDLSLSEIPIFNGYLDSDYENDLKDMTRFIKSQETPPKESEVVFDEIAGRFSSNWRIAYSPYLTRVYGFKNQAEFDEKNKSKVARWNRVLGRIVEGKNMTDDNKKALEEMRGMFTNVDEFVEIAKNQKSVADLESGDNEGSY